MRNVWKYLVLTKADMMQIVGAVVLFTFVGDRLRWWEFSLAFVGLEVFVRGVIKSVAK